MFIRHQRIGHYAALVLNYKRRGRGLAL